MIKAIEFPDRIFKDKNELFCALKNREEKIISLKKGQIYKSNEKGSCVLPFNTKILGDATKSIDGAKEGYIYPIISTTNYLDSHKDVHFNGCFKKTVKEQQGKVVYALDHELKYDSILTWEKGVKMFVDKIDWSLVGKSYEGQTEALIYEIKESDFRRLDVLEDIKNEVSDFENSIRMVYYKITLGMNSDHKDHKENKKYYDDKFALIANKEAVESEGYFWGVEELGISKEASLVVAGGSNDATSIYQGKEIEAVQDTSKIEQEPSKDTQKEQIDYSYLIKNLKN